MVGLDCGTVFAFGRQYLLTAKHNIGPFPELKEKRILMGVWLSDPDGQREKELSIIH